MVNAKGAEHPVAPMDAGLAAASVGLEIYHAYSIVYLKLDAVSFEAGGWGHFRIE